MGEEAFPQAASKWRSEFANHLAIISAIYLLIYHSLLSSLLLLFTILAKEIAHLGEKSHHLEAASRWSETFIKETERLRLLDRMTCCGRRGEVGSCRG